MKIAVQFHRIGPYHAARLNGASSLGLDVVGLELFGKDETYLWEKVDNPVKFKWVTVFKNDDADTLSYKKLKEGIFASLSKIRPDVLAVNGWSGKATSLVLLWAGMHRVPLIVMSESTSWDFKRVWWREALKSLIVSHFSAALVGGRAHRDYLVSLGMKVERVFLGYDAVDNDYFRNKVDECRKNIPESGFTEPGIKRDFFLASARFVSKKNIARLLDAYVLYRDETDSASSWDLIILGDGELREEIEAQIKRLGLLDFVHLPGFKQINELPSYYASAKAFVHVSTTEQWGLVVNEAMASGLPVIVSKRCGCACELVQDGENGYLVDPVDTPAIAEAMISIFRMPDNKRTEFANKGRETIANWGPDRFGEGLKQACKAATEYGNRSTVLKTICLEGLARLST